MSIRKRTWKTAKGAEKQAWIVDYVDQAGARHIKTFDRKKEADHFAATAHIEVRQGTHTADSQSVTIAEAGELWITTCEQSGLERSTLDQYRAHLDYHIIPYLGRMKLSQVSAATVRKFEDDLLAGAPTLDSEGSEVAPRSQAMKKKVRGSLGAIVADAQERGLVARNVVRELRARRKPGRENRAEKRQRGKLKIGVDIPTPDEIRALIGQLRGRWRSFFLTAIFAGLRSSELRGLRWADIDFEKRELHIRQRADRYNVIGRPKTEAGERSIPLPPMVLNALREWRLVCPKGERDLVFPTGAGNIEGHTNIVLRGFIPAQVAAGVTTAMIDGDGKPTLDKDGAPAMTGKYSGLHSLRHFFASWCINRKVDGGLELPPKVVQERLGHSSITMTMDVYGHLFPRGDDLEELALAEKSLLGP